MSNQTIVSNIQSRLLELRRKLEDLKADEKQVKEEIRRCERGLKLFTKHADGEAGHGAEN